MTEGQTDSTLHLLNASTIPKRHRVFSFSRILAITSNTLTELTRLKVFYVLLVFGLLLIGSSIFMAQFSFQQEFQILKDVSLGAISMFTSLLAIVSTARMLPRDIEDRTVYTILAKPVPRFEYVVGKIAGVLLLLAISTLVMVAAFLAVLYMREQAVLQVTATQMASAPPDQLADALRAVRAFAFNVDLVPGIIIIFIKACLLATLTLFVSTFATSSIFTVVIMVFVYFIGHLEATAREYWLHEHGSGMITRSFLAIVALLFPDLQAFNLVDDIVAGTAISLAVFVRTALLGVFYTVIYTLLAVFVQAHVAWENTEWGRMLLLFRHITTLQPRVLLFWDTAAWHMAWNASVAAMNDPNQPRQTLRVKTQREYFALGKDFLERGIKNNPDRPELYEALARLYKEKYKDHESASEYYAKAAALPGAAPWDRRFSAYELSYCEVREREAYERLRHF